MGRREFMGDDDEWVNVGFYLFSLVLESLGEGDMIRDIFLLFF